MEGICTHICPWGRTLVVHSPLGSKSLWDIVLLLCCHHLVVLRSLYRRRKSDHRKYFHLVLLAL